LLAPDGRNYFGTQAKKGYSFSFGILDEFGEKRVDSRLLPELGFLPR
jgi:hypothetical protein